jgi:hypothetical protein
MSIQKPTENLNISIQDALVGVLAVIYESELVDSVNMGDVVRLFGKTTSAHDNEWVNFADSEFLELYTKYKLKQELKRVAMATHLAEIVESNVDHQIDPNRILH